MSMNRQDTEGKFFKQLQVDTERFQSMQQYHLLSVTDLSDDCNLYPFVKKSCQIQQAGNQHYEEIKNAYHQNEYEIIRLEKTSTRSQFDYPDVVHHTAHYEEFGRYNRITNPNEYVIRSTGDGFGDSNQRLSSMLASGKEMPHLQMETASLTKNLEQRIYDHRNKEDGGQAGLISYTYPDMMGQRTVDWYAHRQIVHAERRVDATLPTLIVSSGEGMAADNRNPEDDKDYGFSQVTAIQETEVFAMRPYTASSARGSYVLIKKGLTDEQRASVLEAVKRPNEEAVNLVSNHQVQDAASNVALKPELSRRQNFKLSKQRPFSVNHAHPVKVFDKPYSPFLYQQTVNQGVYVNDLVPVDASKKCPGNSLTLSE